MDEHYDMLTMFHSNELVHVPMTDPTAIHDWCFINNIRAEYAGSLYRKIMVWIVPNKDERTMFLLRWK